MITRRAALTLTYNSADISTDIAPYLESVSFADNSDQADDLQITLADAKGLWIGSWYPQKGATLKAKITVTDWLKPGDTAELYAGQFFIDEIEASGPDLKVTIKAKSVPVGTGKTTSDDTGAGMSSKKKSRGWESSTLKTIASQIAAENGMKLYFKLPTDPKIQRRDQREMSDLAFLQHIAQLSGARVKVSNKTIIIYDIKQQESQTAAAKITRSIGSVSAADPVESWSFTASTSTQYKSCTVSYYDASKKQTYKYTATADNVETGQEMMLSERVESQAEAETLAKARLHEASLNNVTGNIRMMGDVRMAAGVNVIISGFGVFDGTYMIDTAVHTVDSSGYKTEIKIHRGKTNDS